MKLLQTKDYHEDDGCCLFFNFPTFEEPPDVYCGSALDCDFDEDYWQYYVKDFDFNSLIAQAIKFGVK
jgi:hypothetical protein